MWNAVLSPGLVTKIRRGYFSDAPAISLTVDRCSCFQGPIGLHGLKGEPVSTDQCCRYFSETLRSTYNEVLNITFSNTMHYQAMRCHKHRQPWPPQACAALGNIIRTYYAALLPRRGPHIASHSVCPSVCPSVPLSLPSVTSRHLPNYSVLFATRWGPHIVQPSRPYRFLFNKYRLQELYNASSRNGIYYNNIPCFTMVFSLILKWVILDEWFFLSTMLRK